MRAAFTFPHCYTGTLWVSLTYLLSGSKIMILFEANPMVS